MKAGAEFGLRPVGAGVFMVGKNGDAQRLEPGKKLGGIALAVEDDAQAVKVRVGGEGLVRGLTRDAAQRQIGEDEEDRFHGIKSLGQGEVAARMAQQAQSEQGWQGTEDAPVWDVVSGLKAGLRLGHTPNAAPMAGTSRPSSTG